MDWNAEGLIIGRRRYGETSLILEVMTAERGRHLGLVRGGRSRRMAAMLQPGNSVQLSWRARLDEHLGAFSVEPLKQRAAALFEDRRKLFLCQLLCEHLHLLPERDPHPELLASVLAMLRFDTDRIGAGRALALFEIQLLTDLGFGLDLSSCAATGTVEDLTHVSPRSGRAVSREAALPYAGRLLALPPFLTGPHVPVAADLGQAFDLTGFFLNRHVWEPREIAPTRTRDALIEILTGPI
jgi:DNA repair protein RecO (recombination protein O)